MDEIASHSTNGIDSIKTAFRELRKAGYLVLIKIIDNDGKIVEWSYEAYNKPINPPVTDYVTIKQGEKNWLIN